MAIIFNDISIWWQVALAGQRSSGILCGTLIDHSTASVISGPLLYLCTLKIILCVISWSQSRLQGRTYTCLQPIRHIPGFSKKRGWLRTYVYWLIFLMIYWRQKVTFVHCNKRSILGIMGKYKNYLWYNEFDDYFLSPTRPIGLCTLCTAYILFWTIIILISTAWKYVHHLCAQ